MRVTSRKILLVILVAKLAVLIAYLTFSSSGVNSLSRSTDKPLLTVFTTFKEIGMIPHHQMSFRIVVENWPSFRPHVRPVVFLNFTDSAMADTARSAGWEVLPMGRVNGQGTPHLVDMYRTVFERFESRLYGYANGDLIFDEGIVRTLEAVCSQLPSLRNNVLVTGIRTNVVVDLAEKLPLDEFLDGDRLKRLAETRGKLFTPDTADYFFVTREGSSLQWSNLLDVVIGRGGYGTYLVAMAKSHGVNVIDTTSTVLAVHLSEKGVNSHGNLNPDSEYNRALIGRRHGKKFDHRKGFPRSAKLRTQYDDTGAVQLSKRN